MLLKYDDQPPAKPKTLDQVAKYDVDEALSILETIDGFPTFVVIDLDSSRPHQFNPFLFRCPSPPQKPNSVIDSRH